MLPKQFLFVIILTTLIAKIITFDMDVLGISRESCRFELHTSSLPWEKAYQACKQRELTLASLSDESELLSLSTVMLKANLMHSQLYSLEKSGYWIGLRMGVDHLGSQQFHWGDCMIDSSIIGRFSSLTYYTSSTACGYISLNSLLLMPCSTDNAMGFICENPSGSDSCFTLQSTISAMGYDSTTVLTSSRCASSCLSDSSCAGIYVSKETKCTMLTYKSQMSRTLAASNLQSTHIFHQRLLYHSSYYGFQEELTEDELCLIPIASPIDTTEIPGEVTTGQINPTPSLETTDTDTRLNTAGDQSSNSLTNFEVQLHTLYSSEEESAAQSSQLNYQDTELFNKTINSKNQSRKADNSSVLPVVLDDQAFTLTTSEVSSFTVHPNITTFTTLATTVNPDTLTTTVNPDTLTTADTTSYVYGTFLPYNNTPVLNDSIINSINISESDSSTSSVLNTGENVTIEYLNITGDISIFNSSLCLCICKETNESLQDKLHKISSNLKLDRASLSSVLRRKVSADDPRPSVKYVGGFGLFVLFLCAGLIVCCDAPRFFKVLKCPKCPEM